MKNILASLKTRLAAFNKARQVREFVAAGLLDSAAAFWAGHFDNPNRDITAAAREEFCDVLKREFARLLSGDNKFEITVGCGVHPALVLAAVETGLVDVDAAAPQLSYSLPHGTMMLDGEVLFFHSHGRASALWFANQLARIMHQQSTQKEWMQSLAPGRVFATKA